MAQPLVFEGRFIDKMSKPLAQITKDIDRLTKEIKENTVASGKAAVASGKMGESVKKTSKQTTQFQKDVGKVTKSLKGMAMSLIGLQGFTMLARAMHEAGEEAMRFEYRMGRIGTLLGGELERIPGLALDVQKLGQAYGKTFQDIQGAMFQAISAGVEAEEVTEFMGVAAATSAAGFTSMETAVNGLTNIMNSYGASVTEATKIANTLFSANKLGKTTISEMSQALGRVTPIAAQMGMTFDEVAATLVALTKVGLSTAEATTSIRATMVSILKPTDRARDMAKALGLEFNSTALESKGLAGFLKEVQEKTGGSSEALSLLFPNVRSLSGMMALASETGLANFNLALNDMNNELTTVKEAMEAVEGTALFRLNQSIQTTKKNNLLLGASWRPIWEGVKQFGQEVLLSATRMEAFDTLSKNLVIGRFGTVEFEAWSKNMKEITDAYMLATAAGDTQTAALNKANDVLQGHIDLLREAKGVSTKYAFDAVEVVVNKTDLESDAYRKATKAARRLNEEKEKSLKISKELSEAITQEIALLELQYAGEVGKIVADMDAGDPKGRRETAVKEATQEASRVLELQKLISLISEGQTGQSVDEARARLSELSGSDESKAAFQKEIDRAVELGNRLNALAKAERKYAEDKKKNAKMIAEALNELTEEERLFIETTGSLFAGLARAIDSAFFA